MGARFAHKRAQKPLCDNMGGMMNVVHPQSGREFEPFHNRGRNMLFTHTHGIQWRQRSIQKSVLLGEWAPKMSKVRLHAI